MKSKKILSIIMTIIMLLSITPSFAEIPEDITVYLSVSKYGELIKDQNGKPIAYHEINLSDQESYNLDDVFSKAHNLYYEDGESGYASSQSQWGFGIDMFWGDTSYNFGYQVNGGKESVSGLDFTVKNGDYIDAFIYRNSYPDTEGYSMFDVSQKSISTGTDLELTLKYFSGYDDDWNNIISPCSNANIIIDGEETDYVTNKNGKVSLTFEYEGRYIISAKKTKTIGENEVPAITAPVCVVDVTTPAEIKIIHNIAKEYKNIDFSINDVNLPWIITDMIMYEELFSQSEHILDDDQKYTAATTIAKAASDAERPGDLAKYILALRALGYSPKNIYTDDFKEIDIVKRLTDLIDSKDESVTNIYTIPYIMIALSQDKSYATQEQMDWLIQSVIDSKNSWQNSEFGTDALTPMLVALSTYYDSDEKIKYLCDESVEILKSEQREDGLIDGFEGYESASTGLSICALSSLGIDSYSIKNGNYNLISGLLSTATTELNGFSNAFATEQGFRGLLSLNLLHQNKGKNIYNFTDYPTDKLNISKIKYCPVIFDVTPKNSVITIDGIEKSSENYYNLPENSYSYSVSAPGYETKTGEIIIDKESAENHILKTITISLTKIQTHESGGKRPLKDSEIPENSNGETLIPEADNSKEDVPVNISIFPDVSSDDWYYSAVEYVYKNNLFKGTDKGFEPELSMSRAMLVTVLHRLDSSAENFSFSAFSDVPEDAWFSQSVGWAAQNNIINGISENIFAPNDDITREQLAVILYRYAIFKGYDVSATFTPLPDFSDKEEISPYAQDAIAYAVTLNIMNGKGENILAPSDKVTRAEVATILMRFSEVKNNTYDEK